MTDTDTGRATPNIDRVHLRYSVTPEKQAAVDALLAETPETHRDLIRLLATEQARRDEPITGAPGGIFDGTEKATTATATALLAIAIGLDYGDTRSLDGWFSLWLSVPSHDRDLPTFASMVLSADALTEANARDLARTAWTICEFPEGNLTARQWRDIWAHVGYVDDGEEEDAATSYDLDATETVDHGRPERPTEPTVVYRGAIASRKRGMAWTTDLTRARWFAARFSGLAGQETLSGGVRFRVAKVYRTTVPPDRVYARFNGRGEHEWVIDTRGLRIEEVPDDADA